MASLVVRRNARVYGVSEAAPGEAPKRVEAVLGGKRDPGYWDTARMLLEAGLCLALQVRIGLQAASFCRAEGSE